MIISDFEWDDFVNHNFVSIDVIEVIALRIISGSAQTDREIAIYKEHSKRIENKIKKIKIKNANLC
jgi:hypothetical protein